MMWKLLIGSLVVFCCACNGPERSERAKLEQELASAKAKLNEVSPRLYRMAKSIQELSDSCVRLRREYVRLKRNHLDTTLVTDLDPLFDAMMADLATSRDRIMGLCIPLGVDISDMGFGGAVGVTQPGGRRDLKKAEYEEGDYR